MRSEKAEDADLDAEAVDLGVGSFVGVFCAMNDDSVCFSFEMEETPMKRPDLRAAAGSVFNLRDDAPADQILERGRAGDEIGGDRREDEQNRCGSERKRKMAEKETAQAGAWAARSRVGRGGPVGSAGS